MNKLAITKIQREQAQTLYDLFKARVDSTPYDPAYSFYDKDTQNWKNIRWVDAYKQFIKVRNALASEQLHTGDRILLALPNGINWITIEQAAHYLGIVVVALPATESAANINHIIDDVDPSLVFIDTDNYREAVSSHITNHNKKTKIISLNQRESNPESTYFNSWLSNNCRFSSFSSQEVCINKESLATIIYTSGTTGKPKGVMHSHNSLLNNAFACTEKINITRNDILLSVTPVSHIMERIAGYYAPMITGSSVAFSKAPGTVLEDLNETNASILISSPHIIDCSFQHLLSKHSFFRKTVDQYIDYLNGLDKYRLKFFIWPLVQKKLSKTIKKEFLGNLSQIFCGGSSLSNEVILAAKMLDIPLLQGYGSTEAGGIVSVNTTNEQQYRSVGKPLNNVTVELDEDQELILKSNSLMMGYWQNEESTKQAIIDGKLHTGDLARIENNFIHLTGRKSQLIQLANGTKVSPQPIEEKILTDRLFKKVSLFGANHEKLTLICQLCENTWAEFAAANNRPNKSTESRKHTLLSIRINTLLKSLPGHHYIDFILPTFETWDAENGLLNLQGEVNRENVEQFYSEELRGIYEDIYIK